MGQLRPFDRSVVKILRDANVLENGDSSKLASPEGVIVIPCSDGDQMPDVFNHQCNLAHEGGWPVRPHMPSLHGGAILMAEDCPLYREFRVDELLLLHVRQAEGTELKGIGTVVLYAHAPCGAAGLANLTLVHQIVELIRAKERVKTIDTTNRVICFVHVDYGEDPELVAQATDPTRLANEQQIRELARDLGVTVTIPSFDTHRRRTYFIGRAKWIAFWQTRGRGLWVHLFTSDPYPG